MHESRPIYYWDTNIFLYLISGTSKDSDLLAGIRRYSAEIDSGDAILCTSVITEIEVLQGKLTAKQRATFGELFWRPNVVRQNVDPPVARTAANIRDFYSRKGNNLSTPDVQHLATAIILKCDEMHTTDGSGKKNVGTLIPLSGTVAEQYKIVIREPRIVAPPLIATAGFTNI